MSNNAWYSSPVCIICIIRGTINSLIRTPTAVWIAAGKWHMIVNNGTVAAFNTSMSWFNSNGIAAAHSHEFQNFKGRISSIEVQPTGKNVYLKGLMDAGTNHRIV